MFPVSPCRRLFSFLTAAFCLFGSASYGAILTLTIDRATREVYLENLNATEQRFGGYQISSAAQLLDPVNWRSLADYQESNPLDSINTFGATSFEEIGPDTRALFEGVLSGSKKFAPGLRFSIGKPIAEIREGDLTFELLPAEGEVVDGDIRFINSALPWQNSTIQRDVDNNGRVTNFDVLILLDRLNDTGAGDLPAPTAGNQPPPFYDVNGNNRIDNFDVLNVVDFLNAQTASAPSMAAPMRAMLIPEPSATLFLSVLGFLTLLRWSRQNA